jgi:AMP deaminase
VTLNPASNPRLHRFLQQVVGFDSVDDESKPVRRIHRKCVYARGQGIRRLCDLARAWRAQVPSASAVGPCHRPALLVLYLLHVGQPSVAQPAAPPSRFLYVPDAPGVRADPDQAREVGSLSATLVLRPHAGEAGQEALENLAVTYLLAQGINHGILLRKTPALQFLCVRTRRLPVRPGRLSHRRDVGAGTTSTKWELPCRRFPTMPSFCTMTATRFLNTFAAA